MKSRAQNSNHRKLIADSFLPNYQTSTTINNKKKKNEKNKKQSKIKNKNKII